MSNNSAISKFKLSFHYILSYYFKFQVDDTGKSEYTISKYLMEAKSDLEKLMMNIKQSCDAALKDYINQQKVMYEKKVRGHLTRSLSCTTLCDKIVTDLWQVGSQALDVWTPLFPVDPLFPQS